MRQTHDHEALAIHTANRPSQPHFSSHQSMSMAEIASALPLVAALLLPPILFIMALWRRPRKTKKSPPSPQGLPVIGNLHQLGLRPHRKLQALAAQHGPLMLLHLGSTPVLVVSSASAARTIFRTHDLAFSSRPPFAAGDRLMYGRRDLSLSPYGEYWRQARRICVLHLLSARRVRAARRIREQEVAALVDKLKHQANSSGLSPAAVEVDLSEAIIELTNDITCRVALGRKYKPHNTVLEGTSSTGLRKLLDEFLVLLGTFNVADYIPWLAWLNKINGFDARMDKNAAELDRVLEEVLEDHLARGKDNRGIPDGDDDADFVDVLLSLRKESQSENDATDGGGFCLDKESIKALILDMFAAGTHTTFTTIDWTMAELIKNNEVMEKLQYEIRMIGNGKPVLDEDDIKNMKYLNIVIKEVLRLHTPLPLLVSRETIEDTEIDSYYIPKGMMVLINAWAIARDLNEWDRPNDFWPERFTNEDMNVDFYGADLQLIPFGAGRRGCPGIQFAVSLIELVVANLLYKFDWEVPGGNNGSQLEMMEVSVGLTAHRESSLVVAAKPH